MFNRTATALFLLAATVALSGCSSVYSLKEFSPYEGAPKTAFIDIKQRAILSAFRPGTAANATPGKPDLVTCAEPSPDAISSLASELAIDTKVRDSLTASLGFSQQEAASFIGLRTQSIQLLRDGMYRLCEGYMSGALTAPDYAWLSRRYQRNMVALLTIEQLTRVAQAPTVAQAGQGQASASRSAMAIQSDIEEIDKARKQLDEEKKALDDKKAAADALPATDTSKEKQVADLGEQLKQKQEAIDRTAEIRAALLEGLKSAKGVLAAGSTTVQIISGTQETRGTLVPEVIKAIAAITTEVITQDDLPTLCFQLLDGSRTATGDHVAKLKEACVNVVTAGAVFNIAADTDPNSGVHFYSGKRKDSAHLKNLDALIKEAAKQPQK